MQKFFSMIAGLIGVLALCLGSYYLIVEVWAQFKLLDPQVSVAIFTTSTTVMVATLTIVISKQMERKKDIEAHYRERKIEIYDEFLAELYKIFNSENISEDEDGFANFLREWQRKMILWGGQEVLLKYLKWIKNIQRGNIDVQAMFLMEDFFKEIRKDLGHKNNKLEKGTFVHLILQNSELFLTLAKDNPNITFKEIAKIEESQRG